MGEMQDKYSKIEEKVEEGRRRGEAILNSLKKMLGLEEINGKDKGLNEGGNGIKEKVGVQNKRGRIDKVLNEKVGDENLNSFLSWEIVSVKENINKQRINILEIVTKSSSVKFVINREKQKIEKFFEESFLDNKGAKESLSLRIR